MVNLIKGYSNHEARPEVDTSRTTYKLYLGVDVMQVNILRFQSPKHASENMYIV